MATLRNRQKKKPYSSKSGLKNRKEYETTRWKKYSRQYRLNDPICAICGTADTQGKNGAVDHIKPVSTARNQQEAHELFWNPDNHQTLCSRCNGKKSNR